MTGSPIRVALVEDDAHFRRAVELVMASTTGMELCGSYRSVESLVAALNNPRAMTAAWDVVLMDLGLPGDSGLVGIRALKQRHPHVKVVVCTVFQDSATVVEAVQAGADGYLVKGSLLPELLDRIRTVSAGGTSFDATTVRSLVEVVRDQIPTSSGPAPAHHDLTERERDVLRCLAQGESYKGTAAALGVSVHTVRTHIRGIYRKLDVQNVAAAVSKAVRERIV